MTSNPLGAVSISRYIASSLPKDSSPQLKSPTDAVAIACHAGFLAVGFRLVGLGEDHKLEIPSDQPDARALPPEWNASSSYAFRYAHSQSSMEYLLKINRLGNKTVAYGIGMGDDKTTSFDLTTKDFISEAALPSSPAAASPTSDEDTLHAIQCIFISPSRLTDLGSLLRLNVIQKLMPSLQKEGYEETQQTAQTPRETDDPAARDGHQRPPGYNPLRNDPYLPNPARPHPLADPLVEPRRPVPAGDFPPPGFEDEYEMVRPPLRGGLAGQPGGFGYPRIGERDLYPPGLGPHDPLRVGGGGFGGMRGGGGGMHPTLDDPMFMGGGGPSPGYDPQAPPGARYDPLGPGGGPRLGGGGGFGGMGGRPPNPFGGSGGGYSGGFI